MAKEYLIVDGYNIIHAWPELKEITNYNLENARIKLLDILCNYQGYKNIEIIVVFDAYKVKGNAGQVIHYNNIDVVYTKEAETADHFIERVTNQLAKNYLIKVATSDFLEQLIVLGKGAVRISAKELKIEIDTINKKIENNYIENNDVYKNRLEQHLSKEVLEWMEKLRRS